MHSTACGDRRETDRVSLQHIRHPCHYVKEMSETAPRGIVLDFVKVIAHCFQYFLFYLKLERLKCDGLMMSGYLCTETALEMSVPFTFGQEHFCCLLKCHFYQSIF